MSAVPSSAYDYYVGGSLPIEAPSYVYRQADRDLYESLNSGDFCYVLNARQMGKSSLRVRTEERLKAEGVVCATIDITSIGTSDITPEQWYLGVINTLINSFELYDIFDGYAWWQENHLISPVQRFSQFLKETLLTQVKQSIVVFVDEIDSILSLPFNIDDFFAVIRDCYNNRANQPEYRRLTFALIGVATPADLIEDKRRTPFNIGRAIKLTGFTLQEAAPLLPGLSTKAENPQAVLREILTWTGGQPFLTQKVCRLVLASKFPIATGAETDWVANLIQGAVIDRWETQDEPEHLKTIRNRILHSNVQRMGRLLGLYQEILRQDGVEVNNSPEQMELRLSGLVVQRGDRLQVYNPIYQAVFSMIWVEHRLADLRPYAEAFEAWIKSDCQDESRLLRGLALSNAQLWTAGKSLSDRDYQFLAASQELDKREVQKRLDAEEEAVRLLEETNRRAMKEAEQTLQNATRRANRRMRIGGLVLGLSIVGAIASGVITEWRLKQQIQAAQQITTLEREGGVTLRRFQGSGSNIGEIEALLKAIPIAQQLKHLVSSNQKLEDYPTLSPISTLQQVLYRVLYQSSQFSEQNRLIEHQEWVKSAGFSPDGTQLLTATALEGGITRLWTLDGKLIHEFSHSGNVWGFGFSPDGQQIVMAGFDSKVQLWTLQGEKIREFKHPAPVPSVSVSPDGQQIATGDVNGTVRLWKRSGELIREFKANPAMIWSIRFSPNGQEILTGSDDGIAKLWSLSGELLQEFKHPKAVVSVSFSPDGQQLATASADTTAKLWSISGELLREFKHLKEVRSVTFSPDGQQIATGADDNLVRIWDQSGKLIQTLKGHRGGVWSIHFSPNSQRIITSSGDGTARLWSRPKSPFYAFKHPASVRSASFSPDGEQIITGSDDGIARLWSRTGEFIREFKPGAAAQNSVRSVSFSPNGQQIVTGSKDGIVRLWNRSGELLHEFKFPSEDPKKSPKEVLSVSFSPDGQQIIAGSGNTDNAPGDGTARLWNLKGQLIHEFKGHQGSVWSVRFSPNGQQIATGDKNYARLWNLSGQQLQRFEHEGAVWGISFSPNGQQIATASQSNGTAFLWNLSGKKLQAFEGHQLGVKSIGFSPDGQQIVTGSEDGTARLWSLSGEPMQEFRHGGEVYSTSFSPDGQQILTTSGDNTARLWRVHDLSGLINQGCNWLSDYLNTHPEAAAKLSEACPVSGSVSDRSPSNLSK